jgi:8-oxo-dGTP pyrophosphatase MutT (NUDIX family)
MKTVAAIEPGRLRQVAKVAIMCGARLCMGQRRDNGRWTIPGGHLDVGETGVQGAIREVMEETGITFCPVELDDLGSEFVIKDDGEQIKVYSFAAFVDEQKTNTRSDPDGEVAKWQWIDVSEGLPAEVMACLHVPAERDVTLRAMGVLNLGTTVKASYHQELKDLAEEIYSSGISDKEIWAPRADLDLGEATTKECSDVADKIVENYLDKFHEELDDLTDDERDKLVEFLGSKVWDGMN